ncbi:hypothetical protein LOTGIDRAFT_152935 [Lottia gigantea]|uniref:Uncharacterized protein n=1 Tax=Lottia gigantea TaxID=225164 RepID=V4AWG7_LOTGI|nr:hypothetical protein LOTGIDRAFT_152935 [Lottia gigantea]ESO97831.1 hypothetical protein LOTGIDRAFT_152935 [Lottia gigantea]
MKSVRKVLERGCQFITKHSYSESAVLQDVRVTSRLPAVSEPYVKPTTRKERSMGDIPGPSSLPLIGALWQYLPGGRFYGVDFNESVKSLQKMYGDVVREDIVPGFTVIRLFNPDHFLDIRQAEGELPARAMFGMLRRYNELYNQNVQGLLTSQGIEWQQMRREVQQKISSPQAVRSFVKSQMSVAEEFLDRMDGLRDRDGTVNDFLPEIYRYVTEAIGVVCFDGRLGVLNANDRDGQNFIKAVNTSLSLIYKELFTPPLYKLVTTPMFKQYCENMDTIRGLSEKHINNALKHPMTDGRMNLIQQLSYQSKLTYRQIFTFLSELFFGGVDTTGHCLVFSLHALSRYPEVQEKLYNEIKDYSSSDICNGALDSSSYLRAFLKESLRMFPIAPGLGRTTSKDTTTAGYHIPSGTNIVLHYDMAGKDERFVPNPTEFIPERWIRPIPTYISPYVTVPFGFGPRSCPARRTALQEVSLILIKILQKYKIEATTEDLPIKMQLLNCPSKPVSYTFIERET